jgi:hypothetical protein
MLTAIGMLNAFLEQRAARARAAGTGDPAKMRPDRRELYDDIERYLKAALGTMPRQLGSRSSRHPSSVSTLSEDGPALAGIRVKKMRLGGVERELYGVPLVDSHPLLQHRDDFSLARMRD